MLETWNNLAPQREGRDTSLRQETNELELSLEVDRDSMEQVFRNILENSLSACPDPVIIEMIWSEAEDAGQPSIQILLRDNGPGLTPEAQLKIFEPFYTTKTKGTGLGMAITKRIVEAHGGHIRVGECAASGAELIITLPRKST